MEPLGGHDTSKSETPHAEETQLPTTALSAEQDVLAHTATVPANNAALDPTALESANKVLGKRPAEAISSDDENAWEFCVFPIGNDIETVYTSTEEDRKTIENIAQKVRGRINEFKDKDKGRKVLLHFGIGVGDPLDAKGNPSGPGMVSSRSLEAQVNPKFLWDAAEQGFYVIALNINKPDKEVSLQEFSDDQGWHIQVPAYFPLSGRIEDQNSFGKLRELTNEADLVVVMNCISQLHYKVMLDLVPNKGIYINAAYNNPLEIIRRLSKTKGITPTKKVFQMPSTISEISPSGGSPL